MSDKPEKPDLMEMGTRYDHYVELREVFANGIEVINGLKNRNLSSEADDSLKVRLSGAVEVINKRLDYLSDFMVKTVYHAELPTTLRAIDTRRKVDAEKEKSQDVNQVRPEEDTSGEASVA